MTKAIFIAALAALSLSACISRETVVERPRANDTIVVPNAPATGDTTVVVPRR